MLLQLQRLRPAAALAAAGASSHSSHATQHLPCLASSWALHHQQLQQQTQHAGARRPLSAAAAASSSGSGSKLSEKKCEPCEASHDALDAMGLAMVMDEAAAAQLHAQVDPRWRLVRDAQQHLRIRRQLRTKNFTKALALFQLVGGVAEAEGHHPDLHLEGWNNVTIELWTHEREGLSENDFIVAAKLDELLGSPEAAALLSKKQPEGDQQ